VEQGARGEVGIRDQGSGVREQGTENGDLARRRARAGLVKATAFIGK
jgi:hypothetical protein